MQFDTRAFYLILGGVIGFFIGYIVRSLREIKTKVEEVDKHVEEHTHKQDEGFVENSWLTNLSLLVVVLVTLYAAFTSQRASNNSDRATNSVQSTQDAQADIIAQLKATVNEQKDINRRIGLITQCNEQYLAQTIVALNTRTHFVQKQSHANVVLQKAQLTFFNAFTSSKEPSKAQSTEAFNKYVAALVKFLKISAQSNKSVLTHPYPTKDELVACLEGK